MVECGGLENRLPLYKGTRVRIPPPPPYFFLLLPYSTSENANIIIRAKWYTSPVRKNLTTENGIRA